ncbi:MAG TPA: c-type cytochrome [Rhodocyclaceae bacterium]|nr:c-type cytochrome [Rhodocyclaceae bacterium]
MKMICKAALTTLALLTPALALADGAKDKEMTQLASKSGCFTCHSVEPGKPGPEGLPPIGPAWKDVAERYRGQKGAADNLLRLVLQGSNPYGSHWKGKVSGLAMPPNSVAITEPDAKKLVGWILALK